VTHALFDDFLTTDAMLAVWGAPRLVQAMLDFEAALARSQAHCAVIPANAAQAIATACEASRYDIPALLHAGRNAGSLAIPLVKMLTAEVAKAEPEAASHVHKGSTSQDVLDSANVLLTRQALALIQADLNTLIASLLSLAAQHADTPVLARTLMQPATVTTLGFKLTGWIAPLLRSRHALARQAASALALQLGGAVGTLSALGDAGPAVRTQMGMALNLRAPECWHTQRDEWVRLGAEVGILTGNLGKIATDLSLMAQGEVGELAEPSGAGRGGSSAMPHKRNPVSAMMALASASRAPAQVATLLACMGQQHERGLGNWQAELAEWPHLFLGAHGALSALNQAFDGLQVDTARMRRNIDSLQGLVFAEAAGQVLAAVIGKAASHHVLEQLSQQAVAEGRHLHQLTLAHVQADAALRTAIDPAALARAFSADEAACHAASVTRHRLASMTSLPDQTAP
jgi:3-carboxy-cis,cis-muconate cycloisomerase